MKNNLVNALIVSGTVVVVVGIFVGGWILLDTFLNSSYGSSGTRIDYQEATEDAVMRQSIEYVGSDMCMTCHLTTQQEWLHSSHQTVTCEDCHGPGSQHIEHARPMYISTSSSLCLSCHASLSVRPVTFPQVVADEHSLGVTCLECHNPMHPNISEPPDMPSGFSHNYSCLDCHCTSDIPYSCLTCHSIAEIPLMPADHDLRADDSCSRCHNVGEEHQ